MSNSPWKFKLTTIGLLILLTFALLVPLAKAQDPAPFMSPPYYGTKTMNAVFDHEFPTRYTSTQPPDVANSVINRDGTRQIDPTNNPCARYSGHAGIDYGLFYDYVLVAHEGQTVNAGWSNPENRRTDLGLFAEIEVTLPNQERYLTRYGHLSVLMVEVSQHVTSRDVIGISGNTGRSTGPHLHFELQKWHVSSNPTVPSRFYPVNPYGWGGALPDPWAIAPVPGGRPASVNLWQHAPSITSSAPNRCSYVSGTALNPISYPPLMPNLSYSHRIIDDLDGRFLVSGLGWGMRECRDDWSGACYGQTYFSNGQALADEYAAWQPYFHNLLGYYDVYAFIPRDFSDSTLAYYRIDHTGQIRSAGIDQSRFNRTTWSNPWAYLGRYNFSETVTPRQAVRVYHAPSVTGPRESVGADAVVFVRADGSPNLTLNIAQNSDDAGHNPDINCSFGTENREIYLGRCNDGTLIVSGFRYSNVNIPAGATILRAHLEFTADGPYEAPLSLRFYGENNPASLTFTNSSRPEDRELIPDVWVRWDIPAADRWQHYGILYPRRHSPDLRPIVQELVNHRQWVQGQSHLTFIVKPAPNFSSNVHRRVMAYERDQPPPGYHSARLLVWYTTGNP